jgi:hypothetical protein
VLTKVSDSIKQCYVISSPLDYVSSSNHAVLSIYFPIFLAYFLLCRFSNEIPRNEASMKKSVSTLNKVQVAKDTALNLQSSKK